MTEMTFLERLRNARSLQGSFGPKPIGSNASSRWGKFRESYAPGIPTISSYRLLFELLIKALEGNRYRLSKGRGFTCIAYVRFADASLTSLTSETEKE